MAHLLQRLVQMAAILAVLSFFLFVLLHLMPGSPEDALLANNPYLTKAEVDRIRSLRGLDRPIPSRYLCWLVGRGTNEGDLCHWWPGGEGILNGDLGYSSVHQQPVKKILQERLPNTLRLMIPAFILALLLTLPLGVTAAIRQHRWQDYLINGFAFCGISLPVHWFGLVAIYLVAVQLRLFPASGVQDLEHPTFFSAVHHAFLPVIILAAFYVGRWTRYLRAAMLEVVHLDYLSTARSKGLSERIVVWRHGFRNALIPLITVVSGSLPALFSGALITERVFAYPGMGLLIFESVDNNDHLVAIVVFLIYALLTMLATLLADGLYRLADPRVRFTEVHRG